MNKAYAGGIAALLLFLALPAQAQMSIEEGLWEFDVRYDFIGIPQHFPSYKVKHCVSADSPIPKIARPGQNCTDSLQGRFGRTFTWQVNCSTEWEIVQGMGRIHYLGDHAQGDVHVQVSNPFNPPQPILFRIRGERLGDCEE
jgi:hypothetical protein